MATIYVVKLLIVLNAVYCWSYLSTMLDDVESCISYGFHNWSIFTNDHCVRTSTVSGTSREGKTLKRLVPAKNSNAFLVQCGSSALNRTSKRHSEEEIAESLLISRQPSSQLQEYLLPGQGTKSKIAQYTENQLVPPNAKDIASSQISTNVTLVSNCNSTGCQLAEELKETAEKSKLYGKETADKVKVFSKEIADKFQIYDDRRKVEATTPVQHSVTIVSALIDLHREHWPSFKRNFDLYYYYSKNLLSLNNPLVLYIEPKAAEFVSALRTGKENITKIIPTDVTSLTFYKQYFKSVQEIMSSYEFKRNHSLLDHPEGFSPEYNIVMNSKLQMMYNATRLNPFKSKYFYWFDIGYGHGTGNVYPASNTWLPTNLMNYNDRIVYIELNPMRYLNSVLDIYKRQVPPFLNGGFFGGSWVVVQEYYWLHREMFELFLLHGMVDDDQTLAVMCYHHKPMLFYLVQGWWYDAFQLFH